MPRQSDASYLRTLQPSDHIGLYTLGAALRVLHDYTADSSELLARLEALKGKELPDMTSKEPTDAMHGDALLLDMLQRGAGGVSPAERGFYTTLRVQGTLKAIEFIADHLAKTPGRKNLIWVSGGFPLEIGFDNAAAWRNPQIEQRTFTDEVSHAVRAVNDAKPSRRASPARLRSPALCSTDFCTSAGGMVSRPSGHSIGLSISMILAASSECTGHSTPA